MLKHSSRIFAAALLVIILGIGGCASTGISVKEPHVYQNPYEEVIESLDVALKEANMAALEAKEVDSENYYVRYYFPPQMREFNRGNLDSDRNMEAIHTAEIMVKKIDENRTQVTIVEEEQPPIAPGDYRLNLAYDVYRKLTPLLKLEAKS